MIINSLLKNKSTIQTSKFDEPMIDLAAATFILPNSFRYKAIRIHKDHIARPDLISYHHYADDSYGDLLCKLNGISNPFELNEGDILIIPDFEELEKFMYMDTYDNLAVESLSATNSNSGKQTSKAKNSKRKPNESVIGDTRFKIDTTNRLIIY